MGLSALSAYRGDIVLASAAARANVPMIMSGSSLIRLEEVVKVNPQAWFQAYLPGDEDSIAALLRRVQAAGYKTLVTQVFVDDDEHLNSDVVFGVTRHLIGDYRRHDEGAPPASDVTAPWYTLNYHFVMDVGEAKRPNPPIQ